MARKLFFLSLLLVTGCMGAGQLPEISAPNASSSDDALVPSVTIDNGNSPQYDAIRFFTVTDPTTASLEDCATRSDSLLDGFIQPGLQTFYLHALQASGFYLGFVEGCVSREIDGAQAFFVASVAYVSQDLAGSIAYLSFGRATSNSHSNLFNVSLVSTMQLFGDRQVLWDKIAAIYLCGERAQNRLVPLTNACLKVVPGEERNLLNFTQSMGLVSHDGSSLYINPYSQTVYFEWMQTSGLVIRRMAAHVPLIGIVIQLTPGIESEAK
jgi:hypothetical protein